MKIYTRTGDRGITSLANGTRVSKKDIRIEAYGTIDELSAHIGQVRALLSEFKSDTAQLEDILKCVQNDLFIIGSQFATPEGELRNQLPKLDARAVLFLENAIDSLSKNLPELKNFILSGGSLISAALHIARAVCRRAERVIVLFFESEVYPDEYLIYINRLSDLLFVAARWCNANKNIADEIWGANLYKK